jgi:GNAT superfamily N-acetyltransferase
MDVHSEYRGKGVGHLLMDKVYELAGENQISRIEIDHWEGNNAASSFFGEVGFKPFRHNLFVKEIKKSVIQE